MGLRVQQLFTSNQWKSRFRVLLVTQTSGAGMGTGCVHVLCNDLLGQPFTAAAQQLISQVHATQHVACTSPDRHAKEKVIPKCS